MQYESIINSLKRKVIAPVYLLYGDEEYLQEKVLAVFKEEILTAGMAAFNLDEVEGEKCSPANLTDLANTLPVFAEKRLVIVKDFPALRTRNNKENGEVETAAENKEEDHEEAQEKAEEKTREFDKDENKVLMQYLEKPSLSTCLVFWQKGKVKKTTKLYKAIVAAGQACEIGPLQGADLSKWLVLEAKGMGKKLESQALEYIMINCGNLLRNLHNELEKVALFTGNANTITLADVKKIAIVSSEGNVFNLVDGIGLGKGEEALNELRNLLTNGEPPARILYMIARQFRLLLQVKEAAQKGLSEKEISVEYKLHSFVTGKILRQARKFSYGQLEKSLELILASDLGIKTGLKPDLTLERLVFALTAHS